MKARLTSRSIMDLLIRASRVWRQMKQGFMHCAQAEVPYNEQEVLFHSGEAKDDFTFHFSDTIRPGQYKIRLVGTNPFTRPPNAETTFFVKESTPRENPTIMQEVSLLTRLVVKQ